MISLQFPAEKRLDFGHGKLHDRCVYQEKKEEIFMMWTKANNKQRNIMCLNAARK